MSLNEWKTGLMSNARITLNIMHRPWYWPFRKVPLIVDSKERVDITIVTEEGLEMKVSANAAINGKLATVIVRPDGGIPMTISAYASNEGKLTTIMTCGDNSDGVEKIRFKQVTAA